MPSDENDGPGADTGASRLIKKYANRRLYDTEQSRYVTLEDLRAMVRGGVEFRVVDARTEEDLTRQTLTQIIVEAEHGAGTMLPVDVLRQMIGLYGGAMEGMVPHYLRASMDQLRASQTHIRDSIEGAVTGTPFEQIARANMAMFDAATAAFRSPAAGKAGATEPPDPRDAEIARLQRELDALKGKG